MKNKLIRISLISLVLLSLVMPNGPLTQTENQVLADEILPVEPSIPGRTEATGTYFEIKDSEYLNITLTSNEEIKIILESIPRMISLDISSSTDSTLATLTISGLEPNKTYYKYQDSYKNGDVFVSDGNGNCRWIQDLNQPHHIWLQEEKGTIFLPKDCSKYGIWDATSSTCTLTQDLTESVEITQNNITLDCHGRRITGLGAGYGIYLNSKSESSIEDCIITNFSYGIYLRNSSTNRIKGNKINTNKWEGFHLRYSSNNTITNNYFSKNSWDILFEWSNSNTINGNEMSLDIYSSGEWGGILLYESGYNNIINNQITNPTRVTRGIGVWLISSRLNILSDNVISFTEEGVTLYNSSNNTLKNNIFTLTGPLIYNSYQNIVENNVVNNKSLIYFEDASDLAVENIDVGQIILVNCNNITIKNIEVYDTSIGIVFIKTNNSIIMNNKIANSGWGPAHGYILIQKAGIYIEKSSNNVINDNNISDMSGGTPPPPGWGGGSPWRGGINLTSSKNNTIKNNTISKNMDGVRVDLSSDENIIINNRINQNYRYGIHVFYSKNNKVYHNNLTENSKQARIDSGVGTLFDNGYPEGGNYWSDYTGNDEFSGENQNQPGSDGIGDTSYTFEGGQDKYPFMKENGWEAPINQPPTISNLNQYKSDGTTLISEGAITTEDTTVFKATLFDPDNDKVKLQIELKEYAQAFNEEDLIESDFVNSGETAQITRYGLVSQSYRWRARVMDEKRATSDWQEFGTAGNVDFEVKLVPLYTQVPSPYPSRIETEKWSILPYAYATSDKPYPSCGWKIMDCGCAITSMVMLGRYYSIDVGIDSTNVDPGNINTWLTSSKGYTSDGRLYWGKGIEYLGFIEDGVKKVRLTLDYYNEPFGSLEINNSLELAKPVIAYSKKFGHYFIVDNKLTTTYGLKDPAWYNTKTLNDPENLTNKVRDYDNYFDKANLFSYLAVPKPITASIYISLASPAELLITDPLGRKLGKDPTTNTVYDEIPDSSYTQEGSIITSETPLTELPEAKVIYIPTPIDGKYDIQVIGTESGSYTMGLLAYDETGQSKDTTQTGSTTINNIQEFELNYSTSTIQQTEIYRIVNIDIKPGSYPNSINLKSKGVTPVAVLTDKFFNAKNVVVDSILFAGVSPDKGKLEDVDNDGDLDLILHLKTQSLQLGPTSTEAVLTGQLTDGTLIKGVDSIRIVGELQNRKNK
ncbi:MAG: hypothetical protein COT33_01040 [Candidatus Nealsonbacteria bacterium CG08_land_8_20_14_0_20_38_20]|uniref:Periplasmic copper-binding protein NosD beta helix domain-containing protein n=1 Tax=Candidatus Nealsonbacteria bacterium CG08_land_8_20_14_0_20_38_20 TaxID=1974705 RepID=A0A2H0YM87_9BACT|nr:MAG: hypothetical protein COT33_01040 [Candidatus Nealsonbacteria bacterium CG08_land_8_20_14_0_20_38_20]